MTQELLVAPIAPSTTTTASTPEVPAGLGAPTATAVVEPPKVEEPKVEAKVEAPVAQPFALKDLKLPEGVTLSEKLGGDFTALMNDSALSATERAQKLIDLQIAATQEASENEAKAFIDLQAKWVETIKADPLVGGANFEPSSAAISQLLDKYGNQAVRDAFDASGAGNNPEIFKFLVKLSKDVVSEGKPLIPGAPASSADSLAAKLYTHTNSQGR